MKQVVLDTSVLTSALRSRLGASHAVLRLVQAGRVIPLVTPALFLEYEAVLTRQEHLTVSGFTAQEMVTFLDAFAGFCCPVEIHFSWRPQLNDVNDEMVLEAAVNGRADALVTFNTVHFAAAAPRFHLPIWLPQQLLQEVRS
ncbi:putative toxin-antitoxin system toxin component, PIN family [Acidithiobacillus caldus]|uniref:putative toxin-antitoxin system toxin component, PIN family n=1 Tax=Acidithiobacillus caldus TaxID=33059 RepID=UPI000871DF7E|nr:putative toxin-antitoxin system toxin component, PIN family [Acidithiobacillus caldus]OFC36773.1 putative toxin-antitoxin system toxin component, PIN family [Acidithiobacillus caldus]OFC38383.1 putative toxin-antitoxin system toxin component, PIN family [Acidithiobacillus caldus]